MKKFDNFCRSLDNLKIVNKYELPIDEALPDYNLIVAGIINLFNICFELSWKVMKEQLLLFGYDEGKVGSPKIILKTAYLSGMISDERVWILALKDRNNVTHIYNQAIAVEIIEHIKNDYLSVFEDLKLELKANWGCTEALD